MSDQQPTPKRPRSDDEAKGSVVKKQGTNVYISVDDEDCIYNGMRWKPLDRYFDSDDEDESIIPAKVEHKTDVDDGSSGAEQMTVLQSTAAVNNPSLQSAEVSKETNPTSISKSQSTQGAQSAETKLPPSSPPPPPIGHTSPSAPPIAQHPSTNVHQQSRSDRKEISVIGVISRSALKRKVTEVRPIERHSPNSPVKPLEGSIPPPAAAQGHEEDERDKVGVKGEEKTILNTIDTDGEQEENDEDKDDDDDHDDHDGSSQTEEVEMTMAEFLDDKSESALAIRIERLQEDRRKIDEPMQRAIGAINTNQGIINQLNIENESQRKAIEEAKAKLQEYDKIISDDKNDLALIRERKIAALRNTLL